MITEEELQAVIAHIVNTNNEYLVEEIVYEQTDRVASNICNEGLESMLRYILEDDHFAKMTKDELISEIDLLYA